MAASLGCVGADAVADADGIGVGVGLQELRSVSLPISVVRQKSIPVRLLRSVTAGWGESGSVAQAKALSRRLGSEKSTQVSS